MRNLFKGLLALAGAVAALSTQAQNLADSTLPIDPHAVVGQLPNGLTYYVEKNALPAKKVELRLVVNAGSILEDDHQRGLAHFCEHMAFNGTKHFAKNNLESFLQSIGVQFGADLNAYTSFDETVYILPIPTDHPGNLDSGFRILEDWAHDVSYTTTDINEERPVILEESRLGKGAQQRMRDKSFPELFAGSRYAVRLPIGLDSIIKTFPPDTLRRFYHTWYRPDLMAVIVVGDVDPEKAVELIKEHFSKITNPTDEATRFYASIPPRTTSKAMVLTDKEATNYAVQMFFPFSASKPKTTLADYREEMLKELFGTMINQRLSDLTQQANPPFIYAGAGFDDVVRHYEAFIGAATLGKAGLRAGLQALVQEMERVEQYGFTQPELDRAKKTYLNGITQAYEERDKTESSDFVNQFVDLYLNGEDDPGVENEYRYVQELLPGITVQDVSALTDQLKQNPNTLLLVTGPENGSIQLPSDSGLLAMEEEDARMPVQPYEEKAVATDLLSQKPQPGQLVKEEKDAALGTTELHYANGVTVILKPTTFKNDEVIFDGWRKGGLNQYGLDDKFSAQYAATVVSRMGIGDFSPTDLKKANAGKTVNLMPQMDAISAGFTGNSSVKDLETLLEMTYLYCTQPRKDTALFNGFVTKSAASVQFLLQNPQYAFIDTMYSVLYQGEPLAPVAIPHSEYFRQIQLDRAMDIFRQQFGSGSGFTFTLVGSINVDSVKPLLAEYLGSLPAGSQEFAIKDNGVRAMTGGKTLTVDKGKDKKSLVLRFYETPAPYSELSSLSLQGLIEALNIRILANLREKIGGIYTGGMFGSLAKYPFPNGTAVLQLPCNPDKVDTLLQAFGDEVRKIKENGPTAADLEKVKAQWKEKYVTDAKTNNYWSEALKNVYFLGDNPDLFVHYDQHVDALKASDVQRAAVQFLAKDKSFTAILMPGAPGVQ